MPQPAAEALIRINSQSRPAHLAQGDLRRRQLVLLRAADRVGEPRRGRHRGHQLVRRGDVLDARRRGHREHLWTRPGCVGSSCALGADATLFSS